MQLAQAMEQIAGDLQRVREIFDAELECRVPVIDQLLQQSSKFQGKMLRPMLVLLAGKACGALNQKHYVLAAVTEMVHLATLVHDDVLDEAEFRRRRPTINALQGNEAAVLLGDLLISHAYHLCSRLDSVYPSRRIAATTNTICEGELMQLYHRGNYELSEPEYLEIIDRKTASLLGICCEMGAWAGEADPETTGHLARFGRQAGIAFQIMDDIIDLTGQEKNTGKSLGMDFCMEKMTLPCIHYLGHTTGEDNQWLRQRAEDNSGGGRDGLVQKLRQAGSLAYAREVAQDHIMQAKAALAFLPRGGAVDVLMELAGKIIMNNE